MNRADTGTQTDDLPRFLDEGSDATADTSTTAPCETPDVTDGSSAASTAEESTAETTEEPPPPDQLESHPSPARRASHRRTEASSTGGGRLAIAAGCALLLFAIGLGLAGPDSTLPGKLDRFGLTPASLVVMGAVLAAAGSTRARIAALHRRLDVSNGAGNDLQQSLATLLDAQQATAEKSPAAGEDQQQLLVILQRQDDKIVNLTKALKMYGKPIMEIAAQGTELAAGLAQVRTTADANLETSRQAFARLETQLRSSFPKQSIDELHDAVRKAAAAVEAAAAKGSAMPSLEPLQQQIARTEVTVQAIAQRLEHSEVHKSLLRLEDTTQKSRDELQELLRGECVDRAASRLQERLDQATARLHDGLNQMREGNLGGLATSVREIQREVASVATGVAQIQAAVKANGGRVVAAPAVPPTATTAPAPTSPAPATTTAPTGTTPTAAAAAATTSPTATAAPAADASSAGGYQTGTRTTNSKNVLGAIAKLKQMKG